MTTEPVRTGPVDEPALRQRGRRPGGVPRWQVLFERMDQLEPGQLLRYEDMGVVLGLDFLNPQDRQAIVAAARKAADELRSQRKKVYRVVRGHGFERAAVGQVIELAHRHQARAAAAVRAGHEAIVTINLDELDATTANVVRATGMAFAQQAAYLRQLDVRQERLAAAIAAVNATAQTAVTRAQEAASQATATQANVDQLAQRITALEQHSAGTSASPNFLPPGPPGW